jgi:hypothetical protein
MNSEPPTVPGASKSTKGFSGKILAAVFAAVVVYFIFFTTNPFNIAYKADAGFRRATKSIDPEQLRVWAMREISTHLFTNETQRLRNIPEADIPAQVKNLYSLPPSAAVMRNDSGENPYVKIIWGGGFF